MTRKVGRLDALLDVGLLLPTGAPQPLAEADTVELGATRRFGKYELLRALGSGERGTVWDARDTVLDRRVVVKVLYGDPAAARLATARAMTSLRHDNLVAVLEADVIDGRDAIATEVFDGESLASWSQGRHDAGEIVAVLIAAGRGLAAAHAAGLTHDDFKPSDVLVAHPRVAVTDFGLAAPGRRDDAERADQRAFCAAAWSVLSGLRHPEGGDRIGRALRTVLARGLAVDAAERWPSLTALVDAMARAARRRRTIVLAVGAVAVVSVAVGIAAFAHQGSPAPPWHPELADLHVPSDPDDGVALSPDGSQVAYTSMNESRTGYRTYVMPVGGGEPRAVTPPRGSFQLPRWTRDGTALLVAHHDGDTYHIVRQPIDGAPFEDLGEGTFADDCGDAVAIVQDERFVSQLVVRHPDATRTQVAAWSSDMMLFPRCDGDGRRVLVTRTRLPFPDAGADLVLVDLDDGHQTELTTGHTSYMGTFAPGGRSIVFSARRDDALLLFELPLAGGEPRRLTIGTGRDLVPDVSADGRTMTYEHDTSTTQLVVGIGRKRTYYQPWDERVLAVWPTHDGKWLVGERLAGMHIEVVAIATHDGTARVLALGERPFLSRDDRRVLFAAADAHVLQSIAIDGGPIATIATLPGELMAGFDGPDGPHLELARDGHGQAWRVTPDGRVESEAMDGLVIPAPSGGWRAVRTIGPSSYHYRLLAPDGTVSPTDVVSAAGRPTWLDDRRFAYLVKGAFHIVDVTTGSDGPPIPAGDASPLAILAADGSRWFDIRHDQQVAAYVVVNFGDRP